METKFVIPALFGTFIAGTAVGMITMNLAVKRALKKRVPLLTNTIANIIHKAADESLSREEIQVVVKEELAFFTQVMPEV